MKSQIDDQLTEKERTILALYRGPHGKDLKRLIRLSIQYTLGAALFTGFTIFYNEPLFSLVLLFMIVAMLLIRLRGAKATMGAMPGIIEKYESTIKKLKK